MKIKENRSFKSKDLLHAEFLSKKANPFWSGEKPQKSYKKISSVKNVKYLGIFGQKTKWLVPQT